MAAKQVPMNVPRNSPDKTSTIDVLVVDDDTDTIEELVEYLSKAGLICKAAADGWAALKLLADGFKPGVVVTDLRMPEMDGMEFVERLRQFDDRERPEVIFVSGHAGFDDAVAAIRLGARDMLTKPIDPSKLVRAVKSAQLARQVRRQPDAAAEPRAEAKGTPEMTAERTPGKDLDPVARKRAALADLRTIRRTRDQYFPSDLFSDPCWEMLLDLYDAKLVGAEVTVTSLGAASGVPLTTALRRMEALQSHGLIVRVEDAGDRRRTIIRLTTPGLQAVESFFESHLGRTGA
jgi:CheY-like chemotaxis protein/DNA-binding MarR family transcriptional regulator